ncbi:hypothetical protein KL86APRO_30156 [uncultured Alphaproteobacteria bacterium]|uniref:Uncharacterized protein n=1 Tax=uncultured Alphaproteobacteria bacterium TaxID=91750 RepID=A0A212KM55_9PROT|nr:hypothetical protein KL86APRO_30156 [uncultured Alphaproteobacteria bacterium]
MTEARARWLLAKTSAPGMRLTVWEAKFLARVEEIVNRRGVASLTDEQAAKLEEIGAK